MARNTNKLAPDEGPVTLADLTEWVAELHASGWPESTPIRGMGALALDIAHGPVMQSLTADRRPATLDRLGITTDPA